MQYSMLQYMSILIILSNYNHKLGIYMYFIFKKCTIVQHWSINYHPYTRHRMACLYNSEKFFSTSRDYIICHGFYFIKGQNSVVIA